MRIEIQEDFPERRNRELEGLGIQRSTCSQEEQAGWYGPSQGPREGSKSPNSTSDWLKDLGKIP